MSNATNASSSGKAIGALIAGGMRPPDFYVSVPGTAAYVTRGTYDKNIYKECSYIGMRTLMKCRELCYRSDPPEDRPFCPQHVAFARSMVGPHELEGRRLEMEVNKQKKLPGETCYRFDQKIIDEEPALLEKKYWMSDTIDAVNIYSDKNADEDPLRSAGVWSEREMLQRRLAAIRHEIDLLHELREVEAEKARRAAKEILHSKKENGKEMKEDLDSLDPQTRRVLAARASYGLGYGKFRTMPGTLAADQERAKTLPICQFRGKPTEGEEGKEEEGVPCTATALPAAKFCMNHMVEDPSQRMLSRCVVCDAAVVDWGVDRPLCHFHVDLYRTTRQPDGSLRFSPLPRLKRRRPPEWAEQTPNLPHQIKTVVIGGSDDDSEEERKQQQMRRAPSYAIDMSQKRNEKGKEEREINASKREEQERSAKKRAPSQQARKLQVSRQPTGPKRPHMDYSLAPPSRGGSLAAASSLSSLSSSAASSSRQSSSLSAVAEGGSCARSRPFQKPYFATKKGSARGGAARQAVANYKTALPPPPPLSQSLFRSVSGQQQQRAQIQQGSGVYGGEGRAEGGSSRGAPPSPQPRPPPPRNPLPPQQSYSMAADTAEERLPPAQPRPPPPQPARARVMLQPGNAHKLTIKSSALGARPLAAMTCSTSAQSAAAERLYSKHAAFAPQTPPHPPAKTPATRGRGQSIALPRPPPPIPIPGRTIQQARQPELADPESSGSGGGPPIVAAPPPPDHDSMALSALSAPAHFRTAGQRAASVRRSYPSIPRQALPPPSPVRQYPQQQQQQQGQGGHGLPVQLPLPPPQRPLPSILPPRGQPPQGNKYVSVRTSQAGPFMQQQQLTEASRLGTVGHKFVQRQQQQPLRPSTSLLSPSHAKDAGGTVPRLLQDTPVRDPEMTPVVLARPPPPIRQRAAAGSAAPVPAKAVRQTEDKREPLKTEEQGRAELPGTSRKQTDALSVLADAALAVPEKPRPPSRSVPILDNIQDIEEEDEDEEEL